MPAILKLLLASHVVQSSHASLFPRRKPGFEQNQPQIPGWEQDHRATRALAGAWTQFDHCVFVPAIRLQSSAPSFSLRPLPPPNAAASMTVQPDPDNNARHEKQQEQGPSSSRFLVALVCVVILPLAALKLVLYYAFPGIPSIADPALSLQLVQNLSLASSTSVDDCDLVDGAWVPDLAGPSYSNETCRHIQGHQNCMKNGRPDSEYMYWRWQPYRCELPRFNASFFMNMMKNKLLAFVGDSIARNHMQSLLCSLSQLEEPIKAYTDEGDRYVRWWFPTSNVTVSTFWSPFLVHQTNEARGGIPQGTSQLYLDQLDPSWRHNLTEFDVLVLSSGQWFFRSNLFFLNDALVGCHDCNTTQFNATGLGFYYPYHSGLANVLNELASNPGYHGITILRSFSPDHFEDGRWDNGGSCKRTTPFPTNASIPENTLTYEMHRVQRQAYGSLSSPRLRLLDITRLSYLRPDGHPGPYRNFQPYAKEFKGHVQNDCLHWCIPGPVDAWNDLLLETLRRTGI